MRGNVEARRKLLGPRHSSTLEAANNLAVTLIQQNKLEEAERLLWEVCDECRETLGGDHPRTALAMGNLGVVLMGRNKLVEAEQLYRNMWETIGRTRGEDHVEAVQAGYWLNRLLRQVGKCAVSPATRGVRIGHGLAGHEAAGSGQSIGGGGTPDRDALGTGLPTVSEPSGLHRHLGRHPKPPGRSDQASR
jgi:hypothetical protein